ncbi:two-component system, OmpR family, alkaline phosphatase synthesis response regulator PhoP [Alkalibacterium putridalgicola]|jgi:two-component system alkaline phosphatase synthesis response regulator PhoP|uniref:DNA-binding response regulator n=1 Tax=Alkalibacterium putridalgicola TaxID=426703 RepID=A0A1H7RKR1_9LACT|nr:response regulator transcription factor [Alkalibacterium putridalgicola]GEK88862.1 DNA-binding response regulator [Alkalibacterium putridalgicola]SEL59987.1 two-component system, OmpR family, alkaline phosphatase synthesis response regulator PhoP [Alkalibacterium putridalgicola]
MKKVLIIEDELSIVKLLQYNLEKENYSVEVAMDGEEGLEMALKSEYDIILLDLMLPSKDGMDVCREIRGEKIDTPIIMLTAKDSEIDKIVGLEIGADDYITKPFSPREVIARIKAISRRVGKQNKAAPEEDRNEKVFVFDHITIYPENFEVYVDEEKVEFTPKEFELLVYLAENKNRILSREQLLLAVWDYDFRGETRIVDVHISHLREKIEKDPKKPQFIKTARGFGYKLEVPK